MNFNQLLSTLSGIDRDRFIGWLAATIAGGKVIDEAEWVRAAQELQRSAAERGSDRVSA